MVQLVHRTTAFVPAGLAALSLLAVSVAGTAQAAEVKATYSVTFSGLGIATGSLALRLDGGAYAVKVHIATSGLARIISSEQSIATAKGRIGKSLTPASYELMSRGDRVTEVSMSMRSGNVKSLSAIPELPEREDRVPITGSAKRSITDPLSAALIPVSGKVGPEICKRNLPIFDGWTRYDVRLAYKSTETVKIKGYAGDAIVCSARWVPVAGHRSGTASTNFMRNNRELEAWYVPIADQSIMVPFKVSVKTMKGLLVVQAKQIDGAADTAVAAAGK
jgi:Protein of unknown function (DUF3108)